MVWVLLFLLPPLFSDGMNDRSYYGSASRGLASQMKIKGLSGSIVGSGLAHSNGERVGLYIAWHLNQPWYGDVQLNTTEAYKKSGAKFAVASTMSSINSKLDADPVFQNVTRQLLPTGHDGVIRVYEISLNEP